MTNGRLHSAEEWEIRCRAAEARATRAETAYAKIRLAAILEQEDRRRKAGDSEDRAVTSAWLVVMAAGGLMIVGAVTLIGWVTRLLAGVIA